MCSRSTNPLKTSAKESVFIEVTFNLGVTSIKKNLLRYGFSVILSAGFKWTCCYGAEYQYRSLQWRAFDLCSLLVQYRDVKKLHCSQFLEPEKGANHDKFFHSEDLKKSVVWYQSCFAKKKKFYTNETFLPNLLEGNTKVCNAIELRRYLWSWSRFGYVVQQYLVKG